MAMTKQGSPVRQFFRVRIQVRGLVVVCGVLGSVATALGFLGAFWWLADLFCHFRVQYFVGLTLVSVFLLFARRRKAGLCFAAVALVNLCTIVPLYFGGAPEPANPRPGICRLWGASKVERNDGTQIDKRNGCETEPRLAPSSEQKEYRHQRQPNKVLHAEMTEQVRQPPESAQEPKRRRHRPEHATHNNKSTHLNAHTKELSNR